MLAVTALSREGMGKWCRRLFTIEKMQLYSVRALPSSEKRKYIAELYKKLHKQDLVTLEVRAAAYRDRILAGNAHPQDRIILRPPRSPRVVKRKTTPSKAKALAKSKKTKKQNKSTTTASSLYEITPYDLFIRQQRHNPAIVSLPGHLERELKLMDIYACLPEATRKILEQRAVEENSKAKEKREQQRVARAAKSRASGKTKLNKKHTRGHTKSRSSAASKNAQSHNSNKRPASRYALFVQKQMPLLKDIPHKERMKVVAQRWLALRADNSSSPSKNSTPSPNESLPTPTSPKMDVTDAK